ncbi:ABC transporter ATP-binding protein [Xenophilus sp. Marseille-Q4582]|uniref:ABC transporter ATP-binding protein n=1 Tax=Xenophilus sp. Marseille-Q4582 TaxID=2866600 RepID=UPI001CE43DAA|nr:ABC transporter ATP-binding protein [Xenophilus sp. Marseille-Q4582]
MRREPAPTAPFIRIAGVGKRFGCREEPTQALQGVSLDIPRNSFVSLVGHSGCGKSTLLRIVSGLESASEGEVAIDGLSPRAYGRDRPMGFVFQESALMPWKSVLDNVRLPLDVLGVGMPAEREARACAFIELVRLAGFEHHFPPQLSGGMRQRASIARSLAYAPEVLLLDEPFGALDDFTRREMGDELLRIWAERQCTVLFVTHSLSEAVLLSDQVVVLAPRPGRIQQVLPIDLPRPRDAGVRRSPRFAAYVAQLETMIFGGRA